MKNKLLVSAAALLVLTVLGHFGARPLLAQVRAALVKNMDEPGRSPYQSARTCIGSGSCGVLLTAVPAGKRLVTQHLNATVFCDQNCTINLVRLFENNHSGFDFPSNSISPAQPESAILTINQDVRLYFEPGEVPVVEFSSPTSISADVSVTVTGYLVDLNQ